MPGKCSFPGGHCAFPVAKLKPAATLDCKTERRSASVMSGPSPSPLMCICEAELSSQMAIKNNCDDIMTFHVLAFKFHTETLLWREDSKAREVKVREMTPWITCQEKQLTVLPLCSVRKMTSLLRWMWERTQKCRAQAVSWGVDLRGRTITETVDQLNLEQGCLRPCGPRSSHRWPWLLWAAPEGKSELLFRGTLSAS